MSVFKRNDAWWIDTYVNGRRVRRKIGPDKRTAELALKNVQVKAARGEWLGVREVKNVTFETFSVDYLKYVETNLSAGRYRSVESTVRATLVPFFGPKHLREITPRLVEDLKAERTKTLKPSSLNEYLSVLRAMFTLAAKWGHVKDSPLKGVRMLKVDAVEPPHLSVEESSRLLEACREKPNLYAFTALGLHTGMRLGEILNLTWADVDLRRKVVKVRPKTEGEGVKAWRVKTGDLRDIPVNDFLADVLSRHPRHIATPYVLHTQDGRQWPEKTLFWHIRRAGRRAGLSVNVHPHLLRHTFGTALAANGVDLDTIRRLMGHTDIHMTMRYLHAAPDRMKGAVETLTFGRPVSHYMVTQADGQNQAGS